MALQLHVLTYVTGGYTEHGVYLSQAMVLHCLRKAVGVPGSGQNGLKSLPNKDSAVLSNLLTDLDFSKHRSSLSFFHSYLGLGSRKTEHKCLIQTDKTVRLMAAAAAAYLPEASNSCGCTHITIFLAECTQMQTQTHTNIPKHSDKSSLWWPRTWPEYCTFLKTALQITDSNN